jgi:hypothetical protein
MTFDLNAPGVISFIRVFGVCDLVSFDSNLEFYQSKQIKYTAIEAPFSYFCFDLRRSNGFFEAKSQNRVHYAMDIIFESYPD